MLYPHLSTIHPSTKRTYLGAVTAHPYLLEHGAEVSAANHRGRTPLHLVWIFLDDTDVAEVLLEHGADVNALDDTDRTPMDIAKRLDLERLTSLLKRRGAK